MMKTIIYKCNIKQSYINVCVDVKVTAKGLCPHYVLPTSHKHIFIVLFPQKTVINT